MGASRSLLVGSDGDEQELACWMEGGGGGGDLHTSAAKQG
jgi:hypothetical protein